MSTESDAQVRTLSGWGRSAPTQAQVIGIDSYPAAAEAVTRIARAAGRNRGVIARGLGRAYGDAAQNAGGTVLDLTGLNTIHAIEPLPDGHGATVSVDAGVSLDTLIRALLPFGLWVPVLPGTRQVTIGGAIAADVHGKNHHVEGSFGNHITSLDLLLADGTIATVGPGEEYSSADRELYWATAGGMGLTGIVLGARLRCKPTQTAYFTVDTERAHDLDDLLTRIKANDDDYTYSVAWFDSVSTGKNLGRGVLTRGWAAKAEELPPKLAKAPLRFDAPQLATIPDLFPVSALNKLTARAFNELWFRKAPADKRGEIQNITTFFHPLDIVADWNRVYGPKGFIQYQFAVPFAAEDAFRTAVHWIAESGLVSCLNVLKRFGPANPAPLSFPTPGWTLAVDIPVGPGLGRLTDRLDELVVNAGGRIYLAKDSRTDAATLARMYPRLGEFEAVRSRVDPDRLMISDLGRRLGL